MGKLRLAPRHSQAWAPPKEESASGAGMGRVRPPGRRFALFLVIVALFFIGLGALEWHGWRNGKSWPRAEARISFSMSLPPVVSFNFTHQGNASIQQQAPWRLGDFNTKHRIYHSGDKFLKYLHLEAVRYTPGQVVLAYYDPCESGEAFLEPGWPIWTPILVLIGAGLLAYALLFVIDPWLGTRLLERLLARVTTPKPEACLRDHERGCRTKK